MKLKSVERFHSMQLWWTVTVAVALGMAYFLDANRIEHAPKTARAGVLFERIPASVPIPGAE